jgi:hypothetical protein
LQQRQNTKKIIIINGEKFSLVFFFLAFLHTQHSPGLIQISFCAAIMLSEESWGKSSHHKRSKKAFCQKKEREKRYIVCMIYFRVIIMTHERPRSVKRWNSMEQWNESSKHKNDLITIGTNFSRALLIFSGALLVIILLQLICVRLKYTHILFFCWCCCCCCYCMVWKEKNTFWSISLFFTYLSVIREPASRLTLIEEILTPLIWFFKH